MKTPSPRTLQRQLREAQAQHAEEVRSLHEEIGALRAANTTLIDQRAGTISAMRTIESDRVRSLSAQLESFAKEIERLRALPGLTVEQRAWLWALTDPDASPSTANGAALDQWARLILGEGRGEGETDEALRGRIEARYRR